MTDQELFYYFDSTKIPILTIGIPKDTLLIRMRPHKSLVTEEFRSISEVEMLPDEKVLNYQRANIPNNSVFYCTVYDGDDNDEPRPEIITLEETLDVARNIEWSGARTCTFSYWRNRRSLNVFVVPGFVYPEPCRTLKEINKRWEKCLRTLTLEEKASLQPILSSFTQDGLNGTEYQLSACFSYWILSNHKNIDGILYPTVKGNGVAMNLAIKSSSYFKKLYLCHTRKYLYIRKKVQQLLFPLSVGIKDRDSITYFRHPGFREAARKATMGPLRKAMIWCLFYARKKKLKLVSYNIISRLR